MKRKFSVFSVQFSEGRSRDWNMAPEAASHAGATSRYMVKSRGPRKSQRGTCAGKTKRRNRTGTVNQYLSEFINADRNLSRFINFNRVLSKFIEIYRRKRL